MGAKLRDYTRYKLDDKRQIQVKNKVSGVHKCIMTGVLGLLKIRLHLMIDATNHDLSHVMLVLTYCQYYSRPICPDSRVSDIMIKHVQVFLNRFFHCSQRNDAWHGPCAGNSEVINYVSQIISSHQPLPLAPWALLSGSDGKLINQIIMN